MTSWQVASAPLWVVGFTLCLVAISILMGWKRKPTDNNGDLMGQCVFGVFVGMPFLMIAAWMWH